jgi:hypothetical protein
MSGMAVPHSVALLLALTPADAPGRTPPARPGAAGFGTLLRLAAAPDTGKAEAVPVPNDMAAVAPDASGPMPLLRDSLADVRPAAAPQPAPAGSPHARIHETPTYQDEPLPQAAWTPDADVRGRPRALAPAAIAALQPQAVASYATKPAAPAMTRGPDTQAVAADVPRLPAGSAPLRRPSAAALRQAAQARPAAAVTIGGGSDPRTPVPRAPAASPVPALSKVWVSARFRNLGAAVPVPVPVQVPVPATRSLVAAAPAAAPAAKAKVQSEPDQARPVRSAAGPVPNALAAPAPANPAAAAVSFTAPSRLRSDPAAASRETPAAPPVAAPVVAPAGTTPAGTTPADAVPALAATAQPPSPAVSQPAAFADARAVAPPGGGGLPAHAWPEAMAQARPVTASPIRPAGRPPSEPLAAVAQNAVRAAPAALPDAPKPVAPPAGAGPASIAPIVGLAHAQPANAQPVAAQPVATLAAAQPLAAQSFAKAASLTPPAMARQAAPALEEQIVQDRHPVLRDAGVLWPALQQASDTLPFGRFLGTPAAAATAPTRAMAESGAQPAAVNRLSSPLPPPLAAAQTEAERPGPDLLQAAGSRAPEPMAQAATGSPPIAAVSVAAAPVVAAPRIAALAPAPAEPGRIDPAPSDTVAARAPMAATDAAAPPASAPAAVAAVPAAATANRGAPGRITPATTAPVRTAAIQPAPHLPAAPRETPVAAVTPVFADAPAAAPAVPVQPAGAALRLAPSAAIPAETNSVNATDALEIAAGSAATFWRAPAQAGVPQPPSPYRNQQPALPVSRPAAAEAPQAGATQTLPASGTASASTLSSDALPVAAAPRGRPAPDAPIPQALPAPKAGAPQPTTATDRVSAPAAPPVGVSPIATAPSAAAPPPAPAGQITHNARPGPGTRKAEAPRQAPAPDTTQAPAAPSTRQDRLHAPSAVTGAPADAAAPPATAPPAQAQGLTGLPATLATPAAAATAPAAAAPALPAPAAQIAQAAGSILIDTRGAGAVTVHLQPADLGAVSIRIGKTTEGAATVDVTVDRSATLAALQADLGHLHQALDRAGVSDNRTLTLHFAASPDAGSSGNAAGVRNPAGDQAGAFAGNAAWQGSGSGQGGGATGGQHGQPRQQTSAPPQPAGQPDVAAPAASSVPVQARAGRSAVNITA